MAGKKTQGSPASKEALIELIYKHNSIREFSRIIQEDPADVQRWKSGKVKIHPRAVVTIVKIFGIDPEILRPDLFTGVGFVFKKDKK